MKLRGASTTIATDDLLFGLAHCPARFLLPFWVGDPCKPSFSTIAGKGDNPTYCWIEELNIDLSKHNRFYGIESLDHQLVCIIWNSKTTKNTRVNRIGAKSYESQ